MLRIEDIPELWPISTNFLLPFFVAGQADVRLYWRIMEIVSARQETDSALAKETPDIFECAKEAQIKASAKVTRDFRQMVNDPAFSDVKFLCSDGNRVHANKMILAGRSDVLKSMFTNGMAESNLSEIKSEMSSLVLLSVFEFIYTGTLVDNLPQSWKMACEVIVASQFFLLTELDMVIRKYMQTQIDSVIEDLPKVASLLTEAVGFKALGEHTDVTLMVLVKILDSNLFDSTFIQNLSEDAFHFFLANSKGKCDLDKLSFREYLRFRQVIRWWVHQSGIESCETEELINFLAPDVKTAKKRALFICRNQGNLEVLESPEKDNAVLLDGRNSLQLGEALRNVAIRLLSNIDYRCIHPVILAKVVEPLDISSTKVISAFRFHALSRAMVFKTLEWEHGGSYATVEQGFVIYGTGTGRGTRTEIAVMKAALSLPCGLFQWSFTLEELSEALVQFGFIYTGESKGALKPKLDDCPFYCASIRGSDYFTIHADAATRDASVIKNCIKANSPVVFSFNALTNKCSFSLMGSTKVWSDLPNGLYYPAVSFGNSFKGRVRIELERGFELL